MVKANKEGQRKAPILRFKGFTDDWEQRQLENLLEVNSGKDYKHLEKGNIPVYGTSGYMLSVNKSLSEKDAIGIGRKGTIDKPQFLKAPFWTVDTLFFLTLKYTNDLNFIYYKFQNINWKKYDESTGVPSLTKNTINKIKISIPIINEQTKIKKLFKLLDNLITLYERKIKVINSIIDYFKQQLFNKDSNLTFPNSCWSNIKIKNLYTRRREKNTDVLYAQNKIISVANMKFAKKSVNSSKEYLKTYFITHSNDIIYEGNRSGNFKYGRFVQNDLGDGIVSHVFTVYKPVKELDWNFMKSFINYEPIMSKILLYATTDTLMMHTLHDKELMKQQLCLPDIGTQNKIGNFLKSIQNINNLYLEKLEHLNKIKKLLLNTMFI